LTLAPYFNITLEPSIEQLRPKILDLMIEYDGEKALIEIATVEESQVSRLAHGGQTFIPSSKIKNELLDKFEDQLRKGQVNVGIPVILLPTFGSKHIPTFKYL